MAISVETNPFQIGGRYENRKGLFEVVAMQGNMMEIQWDTGERVTTAVDLQAKILRNMEREVSLATATKSYAPPKSHGQLFRGLHEGDFCVDVTGTHWRSREQLGGAVTSLLAVTEPFDSWSIYHRAQVHWGSVARYRLLSPWLQTKFLVQLDERELLFGLYVERTGEPEDNRDDWMRFLAWTEKAAHAEWLHQTLRTTGSTLQNPYLEYPEQALLGHLTAEDGGRFRYHTAEVRDFPASELSALLGALPERHYFNGVICRVIPRETAIAEGVGISQTIAGFFNTLLPIYHSRPV